MEYRFTFCLLVFGNQLWVWGCWCGEEVKCFRNTTSLWSHISFSMNEVRRKTNNSLHQWWPCLSDEQLLLHFFCLQHWQMIANLSSLFWSLFSSPPPSRLPTSNIRTAHPLMLPLLFPPLLIIPYIAVIFHLHIHFSISPCIILLQLSIRWSASSLQALTSSLTAQRSARP